MCAVLPAPLAFAFIDLVVKTYCHMWVNGHTGKAINIDLEHMYRTRNYDPLSLEHLAKYTSCSFCLVSSTCALTPFRRKW